MFFKFTSVQRFRMAGVVLYRQQFSPCFFICFALCILSLFNEDLNTSNLPGRGLRKNEKSD
jgi:hypothetical protein